MRHARIQIGVLILILAGIGAVSPLMAQTKMKMKTMMPMTGMMAAKGPKLPAVNGYSQGQKILFVHTETSDPKIAKVLTDMMGGSPVLLVPALAKAPKELLARVYVFTNGMMGKGPMGPLGGQADILPYPPGNPGYRPLRAVTLVTWKNAMSAQVMKSVKELQKAIDSGVVTIKATDIVVNMPFLTWPGGTR